MSDPKIEMLQDLLETASDSRNFYRSASEAVELPFLKNEFAAMADAKDVLVTELSQHITARGEQPDAGGTLVGSLRQAYACVLASLSTKPAAMFTYASELEDAEDRLLGHFDLALVNTDSMAVRAVLLTEIPKLRASHQRIKDLRNALNPEVPAPGVESTTG